MVANSDFNKLVSVDKVLKQLQNDTLKLLGISAVASKFHFTFS